jgi:hypothetical protein
VQKDVGEHDHHAVAAVARGGMTENALPHLIVSEEIADGHS